MLRVHGTYAAAVSPLGRCPERIGFRKQPAGIERHHVNIEREFMEYVQDHLILQPEACGESYFASDLAAKMFKPLTRMQRAKTLVEPRCQCNLGIAIRAGIPNIMHAAIQ